MSRVKPLADICPIYDSEDSEIPEAVRVPMSDGKVLTYYLDHRDAADQCHQRNIAIIQKWNKEDEVIGYKAKHMDKKERRREWLSRAASRK